MEGLFLPILRIVEEGVVNETLMSVIRANTRLPVETEGDTYALISCNEIGCERLTEMMDEFGIDDLDELSDHIIDTSKAAMLEKIRELPRGRWTPSLMLDGQENEPVELRAALTVSDDGINVDYTGTSPMVRHNFNVPLCYTLAYTSYALGCILARDILNNAGSLEPRTVTAEPGSIVHATKPAAVVQRHQIGLMLPDLIYGCLRQCIPERVPAEGAGVLWNISAMGPRHSPATLGDDFLVNIVTTVAWERCRRRTDCPRPASPAACAAVRWRSSNQCPPWCSGASNTARSPADRAPPEAASVSTSSSAIAWTNRSVASRLTSACAFPLGVTSTAMRAHRAMSACRRVRRCRARAAILCRKAPGS
jgi:hypothetical protein